MRIITNIAGVITDHGAMVTVVMRMFSSVCSSWWPLDTDVWDQYLKMIINSQHPWTLKMFFIIDCSSLYCDVCPGDLSSDCQWLETGEMIGSNVSNVHTVTIIIIIILDILIFSINNFLTTPQHICCKPWLECLILYHSLKDHIYRMVKEQVQQYLTKPNHCIWPIRTHYTFVSTNEQFAPNEGDLAMVQQPSTITTLYIWSLVSINYLLVGRIMQFSGCLNQINHLPLLPSFNWAQTPTSAVISLLQPVISET